MPKEPVSKKTIPMMIHMLTTKIFLLIQPYDSAILQKDPLKYLDTITTFSFLKKKEQ